MRLTLFIVVACLGSLGCGGDSEPVEMVIGVTNDGGFVPLGPESPMDIIIGIQGGVMLAPALQARSVRPGRSDAFPGDPSSPRVEWSVYLEGMLRAERTVQLPMEVVSEEERVYEHSPILIQVEGYYSDTVDEFIGTPTEVRAFLEDADGRRGEASVVVLPILTDDTPVDPDA